MVLLLLVVASACAIGLACSTWLRLLLTLLLLFVLIGGARLALVPPASDYAFGYAIGQFGVGAVVFAVFAVIAHLIRRLISPRRRRTAREATKAFE